MAKYKSPCIKSEKLFGPFDRYKLVEFLCRDGNIIWMVEDAEKLDPLGFPDTIRQCETREEAMAGLDVDVVW